MRYPITNGFLFKPSMINRIIEFEVRSIDANKVIFHGAGVLKLYVYRGSEVHYIIDSDKKNASVGLDKYYFSTLRVV